MNLVEAGLPHLDLKARTENVQGIEGVQDVYLTYFSLEKQKADEKTSRNTGAEMRSTWRDGEMPTRKYEDVRRGEGENRRDGEINCDRWIEFFRRRRPTISDSLFHLLYSE